MTQNESAPRRPQFGALNVDDVNALGGQVLLLQTHVKRQDGHIDALEAQLAELKRQDEHIDALEGQLAQRAATIATLRADLRAARRAKQAAA